MNLETIPYEILIMIQSYLDTISQNRLKITNKYFYDTIIIKMSKREEKRKKRINRLRYFNPYLEFIEKYYDKIHKYEKQWYIYKSKNIIWDNIIFDDFNYAPENIGSHPNISWEIIKENFKTNKYDDYNEDDLINDIYISDNESNPNITFDIIINNIGKYFFDWDKISLNKNITEQILSEYPDKPWNYENLSKNKSISISFIAKNLDKKWNWFTISERIIWDDYLNYPNLLFNILYVLEK